ncbi:MAG: hypothetical protein DRG83_09480 [Deltaproteobacteria bacterium]|nr:MAG: hypothetical protein DRG83_09480 [Deltaproteobacteria bacterium]
MESIPNPSHISEKPWRSPEKSAKPDSGQTANKYIKLGTTVGLAVLFAALPFKHNKGIVYASEILLAATFVLDLYINKSKKILVETLKENPFTWIIAIYSATALFSVFFSYNPLYSFKQFIYEILINVFLYYTALFLVIRGHTTVEKITRSLILTNILFLAVFFLQGLQWYIFPGHAFMSTIHGSIKTHNVFETYSALTRWSNLFSYKTPSTYCLFFVALGFGVFFSSKSSFQVFKTITISLFNLIVIVLSVLKAPIVAICLTAICVCFLPFDTKRRLELFIAGSLIAALLIFIALFSPISKGFIRGENLSAILHGKYSKSGSFGSRLHGYPLYVKHVLKHPFIGVGIGRRNIKKALPDLVKKTGFPHGHNVFLNTIVQQGIQSAIALLIFILLKFKRGLRTLKELTVLDSAIAIYLSTYIIWLCMFWLRSSFDDMFRHNISTFYWVLAAFFTFCVMSQQQEEKNG